MTQLLSSPQSLVANLRTPHLTPGTASARGVCCEILERGSSARLPARGTCLQKTLRRVLPTLRLISHTQHEFHIVTCKDIYGLKSKGTLSVDHGDI